MAAKLETPPGRRRRSSRRWRRVHWIVGESLLTLGVVLLLFAAYQTFAVPARTARAQRALDHDLSKAWETTTTAPEPVAPAVDPPPAEGHEPAAPAVDPPPAEGHEPAAESDDGRPIVRLYVPKLGLHWVVVQGVSARNLRMGPGHYPKSQGPGEVGNFAVAGHRVRGTFWDLDKVNPGDDVIVETADNWFIYRTSRSEIVQPTDNRVIAPNPDDPGTAPTDRLLTLTTCHPKWSNWQRLIVHAELVRVQSKPGAPPELGS